MQNQAHIREIRKNPAILSPAKEWFVIFFKKIVVNYENSRKIYPLDLSDGITYIRYIFVIWLVLFKNREKYGKYASSGQASRARREKR